jgi:hypothetical protein
MLFLQFIGYSQPRKGKKKKFKRSMFFSKLSLNKAKLRNTVGFIWRYLSVSLQFFSFSGLMLLFSSSENVDTSFV